MTLAYDTFHYRDSSCHILLSICFFPIEKAIILWEIVKMSSNYRQYRYITRNHSQHLADIQPLTIPYEEPHVRRNKYLGLTISLSSYMFFEDLTVLY